MITFDELNIQDPIRHSLAKMGFTEATPIQAQTIPHAQEGKDVIGQAQTGTGKTAAFGIPLIENSSTTTQHVQALVVTPTRELAVQVAEELNKIGRIKRIRALAIYGGQDIRRQIRSLKSNPAIIVGTPGRLMDLMKRKTLRLDAIDTVVLDEADEMLNMGFIDDIETILKEVPQQRQTMLFSATMPREIIALKDRFMHDPIHIRTKTREVTVENIDQYYIRIPEREKFDVLCRVLDVQSPKLALIFGRTKRRVDELTTALNKQGYRSEGLHGDRTQARREQVLRQFKSGSINLLVATDVAARGLDIQGVTHVFNFDIPLEPESYVHRIGRTGRAGQSGASITFVTPREFSYLQSIERVTKKRMTQLTPPKPKEALKKQQQITVDQLASVIKENKFQDHKNVAEELLQSEDAVTLLSAALKMLVKDSQPVPVSLTEEPSPGGKKHYRNKKTYSGPPQQRSGGRRRDFRGDSRRRNVRSNKY